MKKLLFSLVLAVALIAGVLGLLPQGNVAQADFTVTTIALSTSSATVYPSQNYILTATGYAASEQVEFLINNVRLNRVNADGSGVATSTIKIPTDFAKGTVTFKAKNADGTKQDTETATLNPGLVVNAASGSAGSPLGVQGFAFAVQETFALTFTNGYTTAGNCITAGSTVSTTLGTGTSSRLGSFSVNTTVPAVAAGSYRIVAYGTTSGVCAVY